MKPAKGILLPATLNDLFLLAMMLTIAAILTTAMILQYYGGEIPCPLCLLQRVAMFGVCFGIILQFRHGHSARNDGISMLFALLLLILSRARPCSTSIRDPATATPAARCLVCICRCGRSSLPWRSWLPTRSNSRFSANL
jgi:disulfide bond formation protein DsbB